MSCGFVNWIEGIKCEKLESCGFFNRKEGIECEKLGNLAAFLIGTKGLCSIHCHSVSLALKMLSLELNL